MCVRNRERSSLANLIFQPGGSGGQLPRNGSSAQLGRMRRDRNALRRRRQLPRVAEESWWRGAASPGSSPSLSRRRNLDSLATMSGTSRLAKFFGLKRNLVILLIATFAIRRGRGALDALPAEVSPGARRDGFYHRALRRTPKFSWRDLRLSRRHFRPPLGTSARLYRLLDSRLRARPAHPSLGAVIAGMFLLSLVDLLLAPGVVLPDWRMLAANRDATGSGVQAVIKRIPIMIALFLGGMLIAVWCPNHGRNARRYVLPVWLALEVRKYARAGATNIESFVDELLVRRELSMNGRVHRPLRTLRIHAGMVAQDARGTRARHAALPLLTRSAREREDARSLLERGHERDAVHRLHAQPHADVLGEEILEWTSSPEEGHATALAINNKFFLDGRDANSFANIAWVFGQHDRPWFERPIFGKVRYMNAAGLERKCDNKGYVAKVNARIAQYRA